MNNLVRNISNKMLFTNKHHSLKYIQEYLNNYNDSDWERFRTNPFDKRYTKTIIYKEPLFSVELLSWGKEAETKIHDHAEYGCFMKLLGGHLQEKLYDTESLQFKYMIDFKDKNEVRFIDNAINYHKIVNPKNDLAHSIHVYIPGNYQTKYYE